MEDTAGKLGIDMKKIEIVKDKAVKWVDEKIQ